MKMTIGPNRRFEECKENEQRRETKYWKGMNEVIKARSHNEETTNKVLLPQKPSKRSNVVWERPGSESEG